MPEGGTNDLAIQGTAEIMPEIRAQLGYAPDYVCCPVGTGGTVAGLAQSAPAETNGTGVHGVESTRRPLAVGAGQPKAVWYMITISADTPEPRPTS